MRPDIINISKDDAEKQGYIVDDTCYPWFAYKGPRFAPDSWMCIPTNDEYHYNQVLILLQNTLIEAFKKIEEYVEANILEVRME